MMARPNFKCTWSGCVSVFTQKINLYRHISRVHKKERTHMCYVPNCEAAFCTSDDLHRHKIHVHIKDRGYKCSQCCKTFLRNDSFLRHQRSVHGIHTKTSNNTIRIVKPSYECAECGRCFTRKDNLTKHIFEVHYKEFLECHTCGCKFRSKITLSKHISSSHQVQGKHMPKKDSLLCCILCKTSFPFFYQVQQHYQDAHNIGLNTEKHIFPNKEEFFVWKKSIEDGSKTRFVVKRKLKTKITFVCHRSGPQRIKTKERVRSPYLRGSKKVGGICPATITLHMNKTDTSCVAYFTSTHVGHLANAESELKYCFPRAKHREKIAGMIASGIPKRRIEKATDNLANKMVQKLYKLAESVPMWSKDDLKMMNSVINQLEAAYSSSQMKTSLPLCQQTQENQEG